MQLVIERGELLRALGHVTSVVERRTTIPILSNVLLKASERALQFKATDLEREVSDEAPADVSQPGAVTVPAHMLHDIVRKLPDGAQVEMKRDPEKERLTLRSGQSRFRPADAGTGGFSRSRRGRVRPQVRDRRQGPEAPDRQDALCHLHGGDALLPQRHLSARRAARQGADLARGGHRRPSAGAGGAALPQGRRRHAGHHPAAQDGARAAPPHRGQRRHREVGVSPAKARFEIGTITLTSKLIDGTFPDYGRVIPKANDKKLKVSNAEFISAVDRVSTIASERGRAVKLNISARQAGAVGQQPRGRQRHRGDRRRIRFRPRSRSASTPAICSTSPASSRARRRSSSWPIRARRPWSRTTAMRARSTC